MSKQTPPKTRISEIKASFEDAVHLSIHDNVEKVIQKGLYNAPADQRVVIVDGDEVMAILTVDSLRSEVLPRSWHGSLGDWLRRLSPPPEVEAEMPVAELDWLVQDVEEAEWLLVTDEKGHPVGVLSRRQVIEQHLPAPDTTQEVHRLAGEPRLWGDPSVRHTYWYCPVERRIYCGPHAVRPDAEGHIRDRKGHLVEKREPPQRQ